MPAAHRPSQRVAALEATLDLLRAGGNLSLEAAARAAGMSKPGLMYHFATKEALVAALVDHLVDGYERDFISLLPAQPTQGTEPEGLSASERIAAYVRWSLTYAHDAADLVILCDPKLRVPMAARWADRFRGWVEVPAEIAAADRARLYAVRLMADGCWFADASGVLPVPLEDRPGLLALALDLLEGEGS
ncbi:helix-turn-helix domain-containing protein [Knoellia sp. S7-12]|uniref:TetR/AcrR family transcriptional regulator n=1 Tax=Knoellia sp. S7-12 TaxID=3126698 RepID=UPI0033673560